MTGPELFKITAWFLFCGYILFLLINTINWIRIPEYIFSDQVCKTKISIIIAMRNEETNIVSCLLAISKQNYSSALFEVIVVDDHSSDHSVRVVKQFSQNHKDTISIVLIELKDGSSENRFKKMAISEGIKIAAGELIITTDADCIAGKNWLKCIASYYEKHNPVLMMCPVSFSTTPSLFSKMQALEFAGLIAMGASSNKAGFPLMCNGANLAYIKKAFDEINGYGNTPALASGDDTFLLFKMKEKYKKGIHFIKSQDADVVTGSQSALKAFFQQRKRWAGKTTKYNKPYITLTGLLIYFFNVVLISSAMLSFFNSGFFFLFVIMFAGKLLCEFIFMAVVCRFFKKEHLLWSFFPTAFLFVPYIVIVGLVAPFGKYYWKGRKVK